MSRHSKRKNNKNSYPAYQDLLEYGLGSWLKENASTVGAVTGGTIGTIIAPGIGTSIGASIGGQLGNVVQQSDSMNKQAGYIDAQNQLSQSQASANEVLNRNYRNNSFNPVMRCGGKVMRNGGLIFENGGSIDYNTGQLHEDPNGGIPIDMNGNPNKMNPSALVEKGEVSYKNNDGTYIFSNSLMYDKDKSWADKAKGIKSKYKMRMKDGKINDPISLKAYNKEMEELIEQHELHRSSLGVDENTEEFKKGSWIQKAVNPEHKGYCTPMTKSTCTPRRKAFAMTMKKHHGFHKKEDGGYLDIDYNDYLLDDQDNQFVNTSKYLPQPNTYKVENYPNIEPIKPLKSLQYSPSISMPKTIGNNTSINRTEALNMVTTDTPYAGLSMLEAGLPVAISGISNLYMANRAKRNQPRLSLGRLTPQTIDLSEERGAIREQGNLARAMAQRGLLASGASQGQYMSNVNAMNAGLSRDIGQQLSSSYKTEALTNLESRKEADRINNEIAMRESMFNEQVKAQSEADRNKYIGAALSSLPMGLKDYVQSQKDAEILNMMYPNYQLTSDRSPYWGFGRQGKNRVRFTPRNQKFNEQN